MHFVLRGPDGRIKQKVSADNIVTDAGDEYYAYRSVLEQPPDNRFTTGAALAFDGIMGLGTAGNAPAKTSDRSDITAITAGSELALDGTYPQRQDGDTNNPDDPLPADSITYRQRHRSSLHHQPDSRRYGAVADVCDDHSDSEQGGG